MENVALVVLVAVLISVVSFAYLTVVAPHTATEGVSGVAEVMGTVVRWGNSTQIFLANTGNAPAGVNIYLLNNTKIETTCSGYIYSVDAEKTLAYGEIDVSEIEIPPKASVKIYCEGLYDDVVVSTTSGKITLTKEGMWAESSASIERVGYINYYLPIPGGLLTQFQYAIPFVVLYNEETTSDFVNVKIAMRIPRTLSPVTIFLYDKIGDRTNEIAVAYNDLVATLVRTDAYKDRDGTLVVVFQANIHRGMNRFWLLFSNPSLGSGGHATALPDEDKPAIATTMTLVTSVDQPPTRPSLLVSLGDVSLPILTGLKTSMTSGDSAYQDYVDSIEKLQRANYIALSQEINQSEVIKYPAYCEETTSRPASGGTEVPCKVTLKTYAALPAPKNIVKTVGYDVRVSIAFGGMIGMSVAFVDPKKEVVYVHDQTITDDNLDRPPRYWNRYYSKNFKNFAYDGTEVQAYIVFYNDYWYHAYPVNTYLDFAVSVAYVLVLNTQEGGGGGGCIHLNVGGNGQELINYALPVSLSDLGLTAESKLKIMTPDGTNLYYWIDNLTETLYIKIPLVPPNGTTLTICPYTDGRYEAPDKVFSYWNDFSSSRGVLIVTNGYTGSGISSGVLRLLRTSSLSGVWGYLLSKFAYYTSPKKFHIHTEFVVSNVDVGFAITFYREFVWGAKPSVGKTAAITGLITTWWGSSRPVYLNGYAVLFAKDSTYGTNSVVLLKTGPSSVRILRSVPYNIPIGEPIAVDVIFDGAVLTVKVNGVTILTYDGIQDTGYRYVALTASNFLGRSEIIVDRIFVREVPEGGDLSYSVSQ